MMAPNLRAVTSTGKNTGKVVSLGVMDPESRANSKRTRSKAMESTNGLTEESTKDSGI